MIDTVPALSTSAAPRQNFARSAEAMAEAGAPGFAAYLAALQPVAAPNVQPAAEAKTAAPSTNSEQQTTAQTTQEIPEPAEEYAFQNDETQDVTFDDLVDLINPLHHIPVIGTLYRYATGDTIKPVTRVVGDMAYGMITGSVIVSGLMAIVGSVVEQESGLPPDQQIAQALFDSDPAAAPTTQLASAETVKPAEPAPAPAIQLASAEKKQPFGSVMDTSTVAHQQRIAAATSNGNAAASRLGNTLYTSPALNRSAQMTALHQQAPTAAAPKGASDVLMAGAKGLSIPSSGTAPTSTLGAILQKAPMASGSSSNSLPPDLVRDMMLMGLDKYKTAQGLAPSEMALMPN